MDEQKILSYLKRPLPVRCFGSMDSTNEYAKGWARQSAMHGAAVFSDVQTKGRGRLGRSFYSPTGGLYMSLIVDCEGMLPGHLTTLAAVALVRAVRKTSGQKLRIKWVNDVIYQGMKVGGILTEGIITEGIISKSVIGIGVNTGPAALPLSLVPNGGTIHQSGQPYDREKLAAFIMTEILDGLQLVPGHMDEYREHCLTLWQKISFVWEGAQREGIAYSIDNDGALLVQTAEGPIKLIAGAVSIRGEG